MARIETRMPGDGDREFAIRVERLSKRYEIYDAPRDRLKQSIFTRGRRLLGLSPKLYFREFWALRDISFDVRKGETIGIIGRNGAGKSTLLQVICGTVNPTSGTVETKGRVAALLELGAGFNPEFTGRENVFLNGSLLGLSHEETERHFDEIAAFADIGDFLDQPVKTYSSGMYVRLAFAVQSCVAPEILLVDEALAVGDIGFQYKCFKRMQALRDQGVTILMVTHSSSSVLEYASRCIVLDGGTVTHDTANVLEAVLAYEKGMLPGRARQATNPDKRQGGEHYGAEELLLRREENRNASAEEQRFGSPDNRHRDRCMDNSDLLSGGPDPEPAHGAALVQFLALVCLEARQPAVNQILAGADGKFHAVFHPKLAGFKVYRLARVQVVVAPDIAAPGEGQRNPEDHARNVSG